jgi:antitoxin HicB
VEARYAVLLEPDEGAWRAIVPALPEINTWGDSPEHALEMAREAIALALDVRLEYGDPVPASDADENGARLERVVITLPAA